MWRLTIALPTDFLWRGDTITTTSSYFRITVEISIQGLLRKYAEHLRRTIIVPNGFKIFVKEAFKEAIEIQVLRRITGENYEELYWDTDNKSEIRSRLENFDIRRPNRNSPIMMHWKDASSGVFNLLSFPTPIWLDILNQRNRDPRDRQFILKFQ